MMKKRYRYDKIKRKRTSVEIDEEALKIANDMNLNLSEVLEEALMLRIGKRQAIKSIRVIEAHIHAFFSDFAQDKEITKKEIVILLNKILEECKNSY